MTKFSLILKLIILALSLAYLIALFLIWLYLYLLGSQIGAGVLGGATYVVVYQIISKRVIDKHYENKVG